MIERTFKRHEYEYRRRLRLPEMLDSTRRKLAALENEARRFGMDHLITTERSA